MMILQDQKKRNKSCPIRSLLVYCPTHRAQFKVGRTCARQWSQNGSVRKGVDFMRGKNITAVALTKGMLVYAERHHPSDNFTDHLLMAQTGSETNCDRDVRKQTKL